MYKVRLSISKPGFQKKYLDGIYVPAAKKMKILDMQNDCIRYIKLQLIKANPDFESVDIEVTTFKKIKTQFIYNAANV